MTPTMQPRKFINPKEQGQQKKTRTAKKARKKKIRKPV